jgi:hypothetical protein
LVLGIGLFENFDENSAIRESLINPDDNSTNRIYRFADIILSPHRLWI